MNAYLILADALKYPPSPRNEWTEESAQKAVALSSVVNPDHGKVDPLQSLRWSEDVMPKLISWFQAHPSEVVA